MAKNKQQNDNGAAQQDAPQDQQNGAQDQAQQDGAPKDDAQQDAPKDGEAADQVKPVDGEAPKDPAAPEAPVDEKPADEDGEAEKVDPVAALREELLEKFNDHTAFVDEALEGVRERLRNLESGMTEVCQKLEVTVAASPEGIAQLIQDVANLRNELSGLSGRMKHFL